MNLLLLGYNGFLGPAIAEQALALGHRVIAVGRSPMPRITPPHTGFMYRRMDRLDTTSVLAAIEDGNITVVVDIIAMTVDTTRPLLQALSRAPLQYVMLSSCDVYANYGRIHGRDKKITAAEMLTERSPLRGSRYLYRGATPRDPAAPDGYLDGYDKIPIEEQVQQLLAHWTILRLPMVYGPGDPQRRFDWAIMPMLADEARIALPRAWNAWTSTYGFIDNIAYNIALAAGSDHARNRIFNLGEVSPCPHAQWLQRIAEVLGWKGTVDIRDFTTDALGEQIAALDLSVALNVSSAAFRTALNPTDPVAEQAALERTVEDRRSAG